MNLYTEWIEHVLTDTEKETSHTIFPFTLAGTSGLEKKGFSKKEDWKKIERGKQVEYSLSQSHVLIKRETKQVEYALSQSHVFIKRETKQVEYALSQSHVFIKREENK